MISSDPTFDYLKTVAETVALQAELPVPCEERYVRHLLHKTEEFELYCIVWATEAETPFHGHPDGGCWMRVLSGELVETTVSATNVLGPNATAFQKGPNGIHKIGARGPSKSLHLYKPAAL